MANERLQAAIEEAVRNVTLTQQRSDAELQKFAMKMAGVAPYVKLDGQGAAWNFTQGPALIWDGPGAINRINELSDPVVVVADYLSEDHLRMIEITRVRGFVLERGSLIDPTYWWYQEENRAAVVTCVGALSKIKDGEVLIVDGVRGVVYVEPDFETMQTYARLRKLGPPRKDGLLWASLRQLSMTILGNRRARDLDPPYDFPEQERLVDLATRARGGELVSEEDNDWMMSLLVDGLPLLEHMLEHANEHRGKGRAGDARKKLQDRKKAVRKDKDKGESPEDSARAATKASKKEGGAAEKRRAARETEIEAERKRVRGAAEEKKAAETEADTPTSPEPPSTELPSAGPTSSGADGDDEFFDPLAGM